MGPTATVVHRWHAYQRFATKRRPSAARCRPSAARCRLLQTKLLLPIRSQIQQLLVGYPKPEPGRPPVGLGTSVARTGPAWTVFTELAAPSQGSSSRCFQHGRLNPRPLSWSTRKTTSPPQNCAVPLISNRPSVAIQTNTRKRPGKSNMD